MNNYFIIDTEQQNQNRKRTITRVALLAIVIVGMLGTIALFSQSENSNSLVINNMVYLSEKSNELVITSQRNMTVCTSQKAEHQPVIQEQCTVYSSTQDIVAYNNGDNKIIAHIVYRDLQSLSQFNPQGNLIPDEDSFAEVFNNEISLIFKATISTDGTLLKLEQPKGNNVSQIAIRLTERLIEQYFPQLNSTLYFENSSSSNSLLRSSQEESIQQIIEDTYLGQINPQYTFNSLPQGDIILSKSYNSESFVNFAYNLGGKIPDITFESNFLVRDGKVEQNTEVMVFNITHSHDEFLLSADNSIPINNSTEYEELIGQAFTRIESNFQLISTGYNQTLIEEIKNYDNSDSFELVNLEETGGKLKIIKNKNNQGENNQLLGEGTEVPLIDKKFDVFRKQIVGNTLGLTIEYLNYENYSLIQSAIYLNGQKVFNVYGKRVDHPWYACEAKNSSDKGTLKKTVFQVVYPLLGGVLNIPITASIELYYGWSFDTSKDEQGLCTLQFHPFAKPTLGVEGSISVWKVAEGGVFAKGSVANVYLDFLLQLDRSNLQALLSVDAHLIPFEYKIGAFYSYIKCNIKNIKEKITQFKWKEICWKTPKEEISFLEGSLLSPLNYNLYTETCPLLKPSTL
ncbi:transmembrane protein, putative (macronuclear) [Tetrahymena thermophila SB210]|uniref:Transmembrane protein, putative n=1 Tax=Tetrahymena thermophila (strain SB210) TaxID=312017 RepID=Q24HJ3_TETTS|nr:transmembrane protein, putative [Tetrahymena thermophila SB210]EAS07238.1 transmembrane protein, putative [Tetrahymena thermophila SB210]|eukprot:XP_001027480.1 transmembrane protein, putative [Tetrahymena thermophila SB210]